MYRDAYHNDTRLPEYEIIAGTVKSYYQEAQKLVKQILKKQEEYFQSLSNICYIYIWGYSFAGVDIPYLQKIVEVNKNLPKLKWYISYYCKKDKEKALNQMEKLGINTDSIQFPKSQDLQIN
ncbi:MAG: AbiH family protein [Odoribacter sp.]